MKFRFSLCVVERLAVFIVLSLVRSNGRTRRVDFCTTALYIGYPSRTSRLCGNHIASLVFPALVSAIAPPRGLKYPDALGTTFVGGIRTFPSTSIFIRYFGPPGTSEPLSALGSPV